MTGAIFARTAVTGGKGAAMAEIFAGATAKGAAFKAGRVVFRGDRFKNIFLSLQAIGGSEAI